MEKELFGVDELNEVIEQFFFELGYEIDCCLESDFSYYTGSEEIAYSLFIMENSDKGFKEFLKRAYSEIPSCSLFVISLLHELGHYLTIPTFTENEKRFFAFKKFILEKRKAKTDEEQIQKQIDYCYLPEEKIATDKAIEILITNYDFIHTYEKTIFSAILDFYKKNNISD